MTELRCQVVRYQGGSSVMPGRDGIEILAVSFFKGSELDELVAHHVRIRGQAPFDGVDRVFDHVVPVFPVQGDDFELATVFLGTVGGNLDVFFGRAVDEPVFLFHPDPDVEDRRVVTHFFQAVDDNGGIDASGNQCGNVHDGKFLWNPSSGPAFWQGVRFWLRDGGPVFRSGFPGTWQR